MEKLFEEIVPRDEYPFMAMHGFLSGDGWFGEFAAYAAIGADFSRKAVLVYTFGYTADSTIDSSLFDPSMISKTRELILIKASKKVMAWFWDKGSSITPAGSGQKFRLLSREEREQQKDRIQLSRQAKDVLFSGGEALNDLWRPRLDLLTWRA